MWDPVWAVVVKSPGMARQLKSTNVNFLDETQKLKIVDFRKNSKTYFFEFCTNLALIYLFFQERDIRVSCNIFFFFTRQKIAKTRASKAILKPLGP